MCVCPYIYIYMCVCDKKNIYFLLKLESLPSLLMTDGPSASLVLQELEEKRKERSQVAYQRKKQLTRLKVKAEKAAEEKLGSQLDVLASVKY